MITFKQYLIESNTSIPRSLRALFKSDVTNIHYYVLELNELYPNGIVPGNIQYWLLQHYIVDENIIKTIKNPNNDFQLYVFNNMPSNSHLLVNIDKDILVKVLTTDERFIKHNNVHAKLLISKCFKDNQILMNKWLRYADTMKE